MPFRPIIEKKPVTMALKTKGVELSKTQNILFSFEIKRKWAS